MTFNLKSIMLQESIEEKFWSKVEKIENECWVWIAGKTNYGYGLFYLDGKMIRTNRFSWELHHGLIPDGMDVLHTCDNPPCVHPDHLFLGTQLDNNLDCIEKGRNWHSYLTHCPSGHEYNMNNTRIDTDGRRYCLVCKRERTLNLKYRKRGY